MLTAKIFYFICQIVVLLSLPTVTVMALFFLAFVGDAPMTTATHRLIYGVLTVFIAYAVLALLCLIRSLHNPAAILPAFIIIALTLLALFLAIVFKVVS